ncbi:hypothetical protein BSKO_01512 [Bryopsis sp. KO-2023]|nr:hypothetical protein BSKO_01512 [Bryopsis sp. KO-2023]
MHVFRVSSPCCHPGKPVLAAGSLNRPSSGSNRPFFPIPPLHYRTSSRHPIQSLSAVASPEIEQGSHVAILQGLGEMGDVSARHLPWLLRLAHVRAKVEGGDSSEALQESARGLLVWQAALERGLLPDDNTLSQLKADGELFAAGRSVSELQWPAEPLRSTLIRGMSRLDVARFAKKYSGVREALIMSLLSTVCKYHKVLAGEEEEVSTERATDFDGNRYETIAELKEKEARARAVRMNQGISAEELAASEKKKKKKKKVKKDPLAGLPLDKRTAVEVTRELFKMWLAPMQALSKAGKAFEGLESLLGGGRAGEFDLGGQLWERKGWAQMDELRQKLEDLKELRDLVRSLGRGGGWGPLRRAPVQYLDMKGRDGLLRTVLEQQETRGLTRSDDISRLLPSESALLARGREIRQAKLLFFAKLAEKALATYERDGWGDFPTNIIPERREIRPTADRGPILLCVDTSGSMRGPRETVAKSLSLECMRAAKEQERGCYVFAFSGPQEVRELELNQDMKSVNNLLDFLEKVFNGGSDFNEPVKRCLDRLTDAKWANSDILLVSDGELRQPGQEIMRKLAGAKEKLGLRVHGLIIGSPEERRSDPAVLRSLCTNYLSNGKTEIRIQEFENWASVKEDDSMKFDWDDIEGDTRRKMAGLRQEALRKAEMKRLRLEGKQKKKGKKH